ncbi:type IX secretion system sortase PorU [Fulvivirga sp.]|uniref:type IX secretion system sortase PorU n=1 Tax=Fulvivirga sp. TaxID=1931237 RepID=UPI0032EC5C0C
MPRRLLLVLIILSSSAANLLSQSSVFDSGQWFKMRIDQRGVYKLTYDYLKSAGLNVDNINPRTLKIYGLKGGSLAQSLADTRFNDPQQLAIWVEGEADGKFNPGDYILFYADDGDSYTYDGSELTYNHNPYADENYYYITSSGANGLRIQSQENLGNDFPAINSYDDFKYHEIEKYNLLASGREWYSDRFDLTTNMEYDFNFGTLAANSSIKVTANLMAQSFQPSSFDIAVNGTVLGNTPIETVLDFTQNVNRYRIKGKESTATFTSDSELASDGNVKVGLTFKKAASGQSIGFLNNLLIEVKKPLSYNNSAFLFRSIESGDNANSTFNISNGNNNILVWDVSDRSLPSNQIYTLEGSTIRFGAETRGLKEFVAINKTESNLVPANIISIDNQNIKAHTDAEFIIVAHNNFYSEAVRLANFRMQNDGINSKVVRLNHIYNEFSSGKQDPTAIRNYAKYLYDNGSIKYLLLFGRGSYDYKNVINNNTNYVPVYESRNSLHPLDSYISDDYYGFMEDHEGEWLEENGGNHTMDIGIGRLPVTTAAIAKGVVDKIINYSSNAATIGDWRNDVVLVADDGDFNTHQRQAEELSVFIDTTFSAFNSNKFYLDAFPQVAKASGESAPSASKALDETVEKGALIVNFTGHGGENGWMQEQVLDIVQIEKWDNINRLPLFVTATCEFGRHDDPRRISGGELVLTNAKGGGIAIVSTCRPVSSSSNFALNKAFYEVVYSKENGEYLRLGDIFRLTKNASTNLATDFNKVGNRNFSLLGDPTTRLSYPNKDIVITAINDNTSKLDTLKALSRIKMSGEIRSSSNQLDGQFNGEVSFVIFDKQVKKTTLGNENPPFSYMSNENAIFRGKSTVTNGQFDLNFVVPKSISYEVGLGKINLYAYDYNGIDDANGSDIDLKIGSSENPVTNNDTKDPEIKLFIGDSLNNNLNQVSHNTFLFAKLSDENGINISPFGTGNSIIAILDDSEEFVLNNYYRADINSFESGTLLFPISDLEKGPHKIKLKAWDTYNNSSEAEINFTVADPNSVVIYDLSNYPNPFNNSTNFRFEHNRSGENVAVTLDIISPISGTVFSADFNIENSPSIVDLYEWNGENSFGQKLDAGIYVYRLTLRSIRDGAKNQEYKKLILIN